MRISDWSSDVCSSDLASVPEISAAEMMFGMFRYESVALGGPMHTASSASRTCIASASAVECTATVLIPISWHARWIRSAISPRLAISSFRSEEHTSELQSLMRISYAVFCLKKNKKHQNRKPSTARQRIAFNSIYLDTYLHKAHHFRNTALQESCQRQSL